MNGYEFVEKILAQTNNDIGPLIKLTDNNEVEWLEFKAATMPEHGKFLHNTNIWDYRWNVSKALFAMANNIGGAVIVGIKESKNQSGSGIKPIGLEQSGLRDDLDEFRRNFNDQILYPQHGWNTNQDGLFTCTDAYGLFRQVSGEFKGIPVIIIMVRPRDKDYSWLQLECKKKNTPSEIVVYARLSGNVGKTVKIPTEDRETWWKNREVDRADLNNRYNNFLLEWEVTGKNPENFTSGVISSYLQKIICQYKSDGIDTHFIPLYAEKLDDRDISSPATEYRDVLEIMTQQLHTVLLGDPGAGKSTCLHRKALKMAEDWKQLGDPWALIVPLYEYTESGLRSLLLKQLPSLYWIDIHARINNGEITLLLDALNECSAVRYEECGQEIKGLLSDYPSAKLVISSRFTHKPSLPECQTFNILHMNRDQQQRLLGIYFNNEEKSTQLLERLHSHIGAEFIARSPVLLKMVADIGFDRNDPPEGLAHLYQRSLKVWHDRELEKDSQNGTPTRQWFTFSSVRDALAELAFKMRTDGKVSCDVYFARRTLEPVLGDDVVVRFLNRITQGLLLKKDEKGEFLHFSHETIQEYLAAEYLTKHPWILKNNLLTDSFGKRISNWAMPLVFAFELLQNPSKEFLHNAWIAEPLLVAASIRAKVSFDFLPKNEDPWIRGILRAMLGDQKIPETGELAYKSHFPPKYPLPRVLIETLRGTSFWYSGQSHQEGVARLKRLKDLILDRNSIWIELLPYVASAQPAWKKDLSPAQRLLIGDIPEENVKAALESATVLEMCTLLRFKNNGIYNNFIKSNWQSALQRSDDAHIKTDLIALLRVNKDLGNPIKFSQFTNEQQNILRDIGKDWRLSFRLLNILTREGILTAKDIRNEPGRLTDIISRTSPENAYRFMKNGTIKHRDFDSNIERLEELTGKMRPGAVQDLLEKGLLTKHDSIASRIEKGYSSSDLDSKYTRETVNSELKSREWDVIVSKINPQKNIGFVTHPSFKDNIFFGLDHINNPDNKTIVEGDILRVGIKTQFYKFKNRWEFSVTFGRILQKFSGR